MQPAASESGISYPNLDEPPPPSYEASAVPTGEGGGSGVGQLIDLGSEISEPATQSQSQAQGDIVAQLAELGISAQPTQSTTTPSQPAQESDEFDVFARSRSAYGSEQ